MPFEIRQAMDVALEDHRAPDLPDFTLPLFDDLKKFSRLKRARYLFSQAQAQAAGNLPLATHSIRVTRF